MLEVRTTQGRWVLGATILASAVVFVDATGITVALPAIQRGFGAAVSGLQWVNNAYLITLTAFILIGGSIGDLFGRRRAFLIGLAGFATGSLLCAVAPTLTTLIVARALQGIGGALLMPGSLAIITASFSEEQRGLAIGKWAAISGVGAALGPFVAGALVDSLSWRWFFAINLPTIVVVAIIALRYVPESRDETSARRLDVTGALTAALALGGITYGLIEAPDYGWTGAHAGLPLLAGLIALVGFLALEARRRAPMMPLALYRNRTFSGANAASFGIYFALGGLFFFVALNLQQVQGFSATLAGAAMTPITVLLLVGSARAGRLADRLGPRLPMTLGPLLCAAGLLLAVTAGTQAQYWTTTFPALLVFGIGLTLTVAPLTTAVLSAVEQRHAGVASGINNAIARFGGLLAVAVLPAISLRFFQSRLGASIERLPISGAVRSSILAASNDQGGLRPPSGLGIDVTQSITSAVRSSFVSGFRVVMVVCAAVMAVSAVVAYATVRRRNEAGDAVEPCPPPTICGPGVVQQAAEV